MYRQTTGFAPDRDPFEDGVLTDCNNIIPSLRGIQAAPGTTSAGADLLAAECTGAAQIVKLDDSGRLFAGTTTKLFELGGTTWTDRTRAVGGNYTGSTSNRWRFAQFGNITYATNKADILQSSSTAAFADVTGAPKAALVETVGSFLFLADTNEGTFGDSPDRWWCSALEDATSWTPSIATQSATNRITSIPGRILGCKRLGAQIVLYKSRGISVGTYTGPAFIWSFNDVPALVGAVSQESIVNLETSHLFLSKDGFYQFDGVNLAAIDDDIRNWFQERVNQTFIGRTIALHNRQDGYVFWFFPTSSDTLNAGVVYNYRTGKWGVYDKTVEAAVEYIPPGVTWDGLGSLYATWNDLPLEAYDSTIFTGGNDVPAFFNGSHRLMTVNANPGSWDYTMSEFGSDNQMTFIDRVAPRFTVAPTSANLQHNYRHSLSSAQTIGSSASLNRGRFNVYREARWNTLIISGSGEMEQSGVDVIITPSSAE